MYLNENEVADLIGRSVKTLRNDRYYKRGLPYVKCGHQVRYRSIDVHAYMDAHRVRTSDSWGCEDE